MKKTLSLLSLLAVMPLFAQEVAGVDTVNWSIDAVSRAASELATFVGASTFDRRWAVGTDINCNGTSLDSGQDNVPYISFILRTTTVENLQIEVLEEAVPTTLDTVLFIYCGIFDPMNPDQNLVFWDDNDGQDLLSAVLPSDGIQLVPNTNYTVVIAGWDSTQSGAFAVASGGASTLPVELTTFSVE